MQLKQSDISQDLMDGVYSNFIDIVLSEMNRRVHHHVYKLFILGTAQGRSRRKSWWKTQWNVVKVAERAWLKDKSN